MVEEKAARLPEQLALPFVMEMKSVLPPPAFEPQKTAKAAAEWAVKRNLANHADYTGVKPVRLMQSAIITTLLPTWPMIFPAGWRNLRH